MPWQPLVTSDKAVLAAVEKALNNIDTAVILHTCQFIMNVMMQDFPAEVFLQRPAIVMVNPPLNNFKRIFKCVFIVYLEYHTFTVGKEAVEDKCTADNNKIERMWDVCLKNNLTDTS